MRRRFLGKKFLWLINLKLSKWLEEWDNNFKLSPKVANGDEIINDAFRLYSFAGGVRKSSLEGLEWSPIDFEKVIWLKRLFDRLEIGRWFSSVKGVGPQGLNDFFYDHFSCLLGYC